jgi:hypothetical protein
MHYPTEAAMNCPSCWRAGVTTLYFGDGVRYIKANPNTAGTNQPLPADATQFKWAMAYYPDELTNVASLGMELYSASCSSTTPWTGTLIAYDWTNSTRKRVQAFGNAIANKCLFLVVWPYVVIYPQMDIYNALYWHRGNTALH